MADRLLLVVAGLFCLAAVSAAMQFASKFSIPVHDVFLLILIGVYHFRVKELEKKVQNVRGDAHDAAS